MAGSRVYIDWSGDPGMRFGRGSSRYLTVAAVSIVDHDAFCRAIAELRKEQGLIVGYEFHWAKIPREQRRAYLRAVHRADFAAWALLVDKVAVADVYANYHPEQALCEWIADLFGSLPAEVISGANLIVDDRRVRTKLVSAIRVAVSSKLKGRGMGERLRGARGLSAHREEGLQLADMIAGVVQITHLDAADVDAIPEAKVEVWRLGNSFGPRKIEEPPAIWDLAPIESEH